MFRFFKLFYTLAAAALLVSCGKQPQPQVAPRTFLAKGVVKEVQLAARTIIIRHEAISNYMQAMTMPFPVKDTRELTGLMPGDAISFRLVVATNEGWVDQISKLNHAPTPPTEMPSRETVRLAPTVAPLDEGDLLPDYQFTNELGRTVRLSQFKGQALAITFFFTSCPFPNYCPRMSSNFAETAQKLGQHPGIDTHWHLLSITFDPDTDTSDRLEQYGKGHDYNPAQWSLLTGDIDRISEFAERFGEDFWHEDKTISHNLRTVVVTPQGRIQKIFLGSEWTSDDLVAELLKALHP